MQRLVNALNEHSEDNISVFYINREKASEFIQPTGHPISSTASKLDGFTAKVTDKGSNVKMRIASEIESRQFIKWFGNWKKFPKDASKIVNADGTPKIMYHGTRAENGDFYIFDESQAKRKGGLGFKALGKGNYFTAKKLDGTERYGSRVIAAYLDIKSPFVYNGGMSFREQVSNDLGIDAESMSYDEIQTAMRNKGYDGVIQYDKNGDIQLAVTFDSNQIKSVDNIGTFDGDNPDIRYSLAKGGVDAEDIAVPTKVTEPEGEVSWKSSADAEGYDTTNLHWAIANDIISEKDQAAFWEAIANIAKRNHKSYARTKYGGYIIETPNVMMFTDADFKVPTLSKVIMFPYGEYVNTEEARIKIRNEARIYGTTDQSVTAIENMLGPGYVTQYLARNFSDYGGQISQGTGKNGRGVDSQSGSWGVRHGGESGLHPGSEVDNKLPVGISSRTALVDALEGLARRDEEKRLVNTYRTYIKNAQADQERLVKTRKEIARLQRH